MKYIERALTREIKEAAGNFPAVILTGPRRSGKTTFLKNVFPRAGHVLLEDPDIIGRVKNDPHGFLDALPRPVILDEIQNTPELFGYIRSRVDNAPDRFGDWLLTGSQEAPLMKGVTESMAGRAAVFQLLPFSTDEFELVSPFRGGFPEPLLRPAAAKTWFRSYMQTYLERDVRMVTNIRDLSTFRRFLALLASRVGQVLNKADLAAGLGVSSPTISEWLSILEVTCQIIIAPPFFENFGKRLIKSPKIFFADTGLLCSLLGLESEQALEASTFLGPVFESFVASEIVKAQLNAGLERKLYHFRDQQGLEVDFMVPVKDKKLLLIEVKATGTPVARMAGGIQNLSSAIKNHDLLKYIVCRPSKSLKAFDTVAPGVKAVPWTSLAKELNRELSLG